MGRKEVLAERKALEEYYYNCKLETPEEVAKLFEVYTKLIWTHHQAGLVKGHGAGLDLEAGQFRCRRGRDPHHPRLLSLSQEQNHVFGYFLRR